MIPARVAFNGLVIDDPRSVLEGRLHHGPIPPPWPRVRFTLDDEGERASIAMLNVWIGANIGGRWATCVHTEPADAFARVVTLAFERDVDAVWFRLRGGEKAWLEDAQA